MRCFWGWATNKVVENKGYTDSWFVWGFLLGFIAFIIALTKESNHTSIYNSFSPLTLASKEHDEELKAMLARGSGWQCRKCKKINPNYIGTCSCGNAKRENNITVKSVDNVKSIGTTISSDNSKQKTKEVKKNVEEITENTDTTKEIAIEEKKARILMQYKELLDSGLITQQEFDNKKKQIFGSIDS